MQNNSEKVKLADVINNFIQRNRKIIISVVIIMAIMFTGTIVFLSVRDSVNKKAISEIEELSRNYESLKFIVNEEEYFDDINTLLADLHTFANKTSGYAGAKAWSIIAHIQAARKLWQQAEEAFVNAARVGSKTYLAPISLFNAAAAAEEQGKLEQAIELLQQSLEQRFEFPAAPRAQFSIGRLNEELGNFQAAIESYRAVQINWPEMPTWQQLARSRITAIEIR